MSQFDVCKHCMWQAYRNNSQELVLFFMWVPRLPLYHCPNKKFQNNNFFLAAIARYTILPSIHPIIDVKILHFFFLTQLFTMQFWLTWISKICLLLHPQVMGLKTCNTIPSHRCQNLLIETIQIILVHKHFKKNM